MGDSDDYKYGDIINISHHVSSKRQRMSMIDRAVQFSPFAVLTGYDAEIKESARLTDKRMELDEYEKAALDKILRGAMENPENEITIKYFKPDVKKDGGSYICRTGKIKKMDDYERRIVLTDGLKIPIEDIVEIESELFLITVY